MDINVNQDEQIQVSLQKELKEIKEELKKDANTYKAELRGIKSNAVQRLEELSRKELEKCVFGDGGEKNKEMLENIIETIVNVKIDKALGISVDAIGVRKYLIHRDVSGSDELRRAIEESIRKVIEEKIDLYKIAKDVAGEKLKEYNGMNKYQVKMLTFAEKMVDVLKAKLGDSIGDAASAKIVEMISWEMKAQRDNNY
jgi:hypothetical protein